MPSDTNVPLLGQAKPAVTDDPKTDAENPVIVAKTAFLIYIQEDGQTIVSPKINTPIVTVRPATVNDIYHAVADVMKDIEKEETAMLTAQHVVNAQMQLARQVQDAQANAQVMQAMQGAPQGMPRR